MAQITVDRRDDRPTFSSRLQEIPADSPLHKALSEDKREGLLLAVRARWISLAVIGAFLIYLTPNWSVIYYEVLIAGFALLGWLQLKVGEVGHSRRELLLILCDLVLMTFTLLVPNPFQDHFHPLAVQFKFNNFSYFYVLLAAATMAYSWRTIVAFATWTSGLWMASMIIVLLMPAQWPEVSAAIEVALGEHSGLLKIIDPAAVNVTGRIQEIIVFSIVACTLGLGGWRTNRLLVKQAKAAQERTNLARHFPPNIVDELAHRDQPLGDVRQQQVAVMFADIVGFTRLGERLSPNEVITMLRDFHSRMETAVFDHAGTLDKFLGDGLMATFGTPDSGPQDAVNAITCGQAMFKAMDEWNAQRSAAGQETITLSVGIHYGEVILGDIGSERRLEFAALGDTVNVASRLEALTRELGVRMAVSDECVIAARRQNAELAEALQTTLERGSSQTLRGRAEPIEVWTA
jgi:adenylate cyclase